MIFNVILLALATGLVGYALYNRGLYRLYSSNKYFLKTERARYKNNFMIDDTLVTRGPSMYGNKYEFKDGKIIITAEERSSSISYI